MQRAVTIFLLASLPFAGAGSSSAQAKGQFRARLSTVPIDVAMQSTVAGTGSATATLTDRKLSVTGTFDNLKSAATMAKIHVAPKGMRGPAILDLTVTTATSGTLSGEFDLDADPGPRLDGRSLLYPATQREGSRGQPLGLVVASGDAPVTTAFRPLFMLAITAVLLGLVMVSAQQPTPTPTSVFTAEQAEAGRAAYQARCAGCHLPDMSGRNEATPLAGANFMNAWRGRSTRELYEYISATMPPGGATLGADAYLSITAFILQSNGAAAGTQPLTATTSAPLAAIATGVPAPAAPSAPAALGAPDTRTAPVAPGAPAAPVAPAPPRGLTVTGEVKDFRPVTDEMLRNPPPGDWLMMRRNYQAWSHSPLTEITTANVKDLRLAWVWAMNETGANQPTPLVHDGSCISPTR